MISTSVTFGRSFWTRAPLFPELEGNSTDGGPSDCVSSSMSSSVGIIPSILSNADSIFCKRLEDSSPPNQVQEAFDDVIKAREDEVRARNEAETYANGLVPEARGQAQRMLQDAEAYKEQVVSEAEGDATRFNLLLAEYQKAPDVTRNRLYLDSIQGVMSNSTKVMIDVEGGNNILYLPLDKIAESARGVESLNIPANTSSNTSIRDLTNQVIEEIRRRNRQEERR